MNLERKLLPSRFCLLLLLTNHVSLSPFLVLNLLLPPSFLLAYIRLMTFWVYRLIVPCLRSHSFISRSESLRWRRRDRQREGKVRQRERERWGRRAATEGGRDKDLPSLHPLFFKWRQRWNQCEGDDVTETFDFSCGCDLQLNRWVWMDQQHHCSTERTHTHTHERQVRRRDVFSSIKSKCTTQKRSFLHSLPKESKQTRCSWRWFSNIIPKKSLFLPECAENHCLLVIKHPSRKRSTMVLLVRPQPEEYLIRIKCSNADCPPEAAPVCSFLLAPSVQSLAKRVSDWSCFDDVSGRLAVGRVVVSLQGLGQVWTDCLTRGSWSGRLLTPVN